MRWFKISIVSLVLIISIVLLFIFYQHNCISKPTFIFIFAALVGGILTITLTILNQLNVIGDNIYNELQAFGKHIFPAALSILCILLAIFSDIILQRPNNVLGRLYEKNKDNINFLKDFKIDSLHLSEVNVIFAFDNSGSMKKRIADDLIDDEFKKRHKKHTDTVKSIVKKDIDTTYNYLNYYKAKLCSDMLSLEDSSRNGKFSLLIIGDNTKKLKENIPIGKDSIKNCIRWLYSEEINKTSGNTDLEDFYRIINEMNIKHKDVYQYSEYVLCLYSDFEHDTRGIENSKFHQEVAKIERYREELKGKSILFNMFTSEGTSNAKNTYNLKEDFINSEFENWVTIHSDELIPLRVVFTKTPLAFYYQTQYHSKASVKIAFADSTKENVVFMRLKNHSNIRQQFHLIAKNDTTVLHSKQSEVRDNIVSICYSGHIPTQYPFVDLIIDVDRVRYHIEPVFFKELPEYMKWFIPLLFFLLAGSFCFIIQNP